ncbi:MAG: Rrf2 family transcriptional regulator [Phycisphaerae bacterium]|nr:Rrf2 family transcriptional regulator [Phycisphaerae bacterium]
MLTLTKKSEYALVAMCHLASEGEKVVSARDIAERHLVPLPLLMNVLKSLSRADLITSVRGAHGGYRLAVDPGQTSLNDVIEAVEGPVRLVQCAPGCEPARHRCERTKICTLRRPLHRVHNAFRDFLSNITISYLAFYRDSDDVGGEPVWRKVMAQ